MTHWAISEAAESTQQLRAALLSGSLGDLEGSIPALSDALWHLRSLEKRAFAPEHEGDPGARMMILRAELRELKRALESAARLTESGAALHQGWARLLGSALGYTASGDAAPLPSPAPSAERVWVTG